MWRAEVWKRKKTNKHESDDMLVNYDFIICRDTQIYYDNMWHSLAHFFTFSSSPFFNAHQTLKNVYENLNK